MAYLLVQVEDVMQGRQYGISLVWVNSHQVRASRRGSRQFNCLHLQWGQLTLCPSTAAPLPTNKQLGVLPQGKAQDTFSGQISQLEVHQLLATSPQVIYPIGLNGQDEPVITTLPDPLGSGISLITSKHNYLEIDIPLPPWRNQIGRCCLSRTSLQF